MKVIAVLFVIVIGIVALVVKFGGVTSFDPAAGAEEFVASVQTGMTWQEVADRRMPKKYAVVSDDPDNALGRSPDIKFNPGAFGDRMKNNPPPAGFIFFYTFDAEHAYDVYFDELGNVSQVVKPMTTKDLLGM